METVMVVSALAVALVGIGIAVWLLGQLRRAERARIEAESGFVAEQRLATERAEQAERALASVSQARDESTARVLELSEALATARAQLETAEQRFQEQRALREQDEAKLREAFGSMSRQALDANSKAFIQLAERTLAEKQTEAKAELDTRAKAFETLVKPIRDTLGQTEERLVQLGTQLDQSTKLGDSLRAETEKLTRALARPEVRGRYGEIQLRRVVELAGMVDYCDFDEQASAASDDGTLRPDLRVKLPNARTVLVDAKCNIDAYVQAASARDDEEREQHLDRFAGHVVDQAKKLADKRYWQAFEGSPEFVVMFVPGDQFIDAALQRRPKLLDYAAEHRVILASPSTLIGLLRAVWVGWREQRLADEARELLTLGKELHDRAGVAFGHISSLGKAIDATVQRYNSAVGSIDTRLVPTLRKFEETGARGGKDLVEIKQVEQTARRLEAASERTEPHTPADDGDRA